MKRKKFKRSKKPKPYLKCILSKKDIEMIKADPIGVMRKAGINYAQLVKQLRDDFEKLV